MIVELADAGDKLSGVLNKPTASTSSHRIPQSKLKLDMVDLKRTDAVADSSASAKQRIECYYYYLKKAHLKYLNNS